MKRIAIVGGGIAGLSAAFYLERARRGGAALEYVLLERAPRLGGVIRSERVIDSLVEAGPDSWLTEKPWARELCRDLGLESELIASNDAQRRTYILHRGRLRPIPDGLQFFIPTRLWPVATSSLFSTRAKLAMLREMGMRPRSGEGDESAAAFVERHYGRELVDRLAAPLLAGVYGGDADRLSARAVLPRFVELERTSGSLTRAALAARRQRGRRAAPALFTSLRGGMQQMVEAAAQQLAPESAVTGAEVESVTRDGDGWTVRVAGQEPRRFDAVILAVPAYIAAQLLRDAAPELAAELAAIPYSSSMTLALGYDEGLAASAGARIPPGFGFLAPRAEGRRMLACTFVHAKFPHRAPRGRLLLRIFLGGTNDAAALEMDDEQAVDAVQAELRDILQLEVEPRFARVYRWPRAMAQYEVGHLERVARIEALRRKLPGLHLIGNAYRGIGVSDCVRGGKEAAEALSGAAD
jgi:protoporphyrinogen/coproporphyrinogen III oxidase